MTDLIERLEAGETGPVIDAEIAIALGATSDYTCAVNERLVRNPRAIHLVEVIYTDVPDQHSWLSPQQRPITTSLDAAIALVERVLPERDWTARTRRKHPYKGVYPSEATIWGTDTSQSLGATNGFAPTPAAALIAALLKAKGAGALPSPHTEKEG